MLDIPQFDPHVPTKVSDIVGNTTIWSLLTEQIHTNTCPHIVLVGPAGCGKTLFLRVVLESTDRFPVLKIDCTANSGLRDLRDNLRGFARGSRTNRGDYRWIVLEHADALTADTQAFLRRMMETTSNTTRIVFECRDAGAIAEPILSRSMLYTVNSPDETELRYELSRRTDFKVTDKELENVIALCDGNLRKGVLHVLSIRWNQDMYQDDVGLYQDILAKRPSTFEDKEWIAWTVDAEHTCRLQGLDIRELLTIGWPNNKHVFYFSSQWSRLGGSSPRGFLFRCISHILADLRKNN
jgi:DNA polymerase III delta prime subunit